jgi:hypothetical protein
MFKRGLKLSILTSDRLKELFDYDNSTGRLVRKIVRRGEKNMTNGTSKQGYLIRWVDKKCYVEHRLIWLYHYGYFPEEVDHINHIKTDNRIENLRECCRTFNNGNLRKRIPPTTSLFKGVSFHQGTKKWLVQISTHKNHYYIGLFTDEQKAALAYNDAAVKHFGEFAFLNEVSQ